MDRVSPLQKAELVELVKNQVKAITLAIGDGANDVGMIQAAHVGIGISGVEGLQAACASDYAISQFRFLTKLLLVHGAWNYSGVTKLILYSFYKNICLYVIEFWFAVVSGFSGQIVFERWTIGLYNVIFTAAPPLALGLFDRHSSAQNLLRFPALYQVSQNSELFNVKIFWLWIFNAVYHSIILFWMPVLALSHDIAFKNGKVGDYLFLGNMVYTYVVVTVCLKAGLETSAWTILTHLSIWGSIACWFLFLAVYSHMFPTFNFASVFVGMDKYVLGCLIFWTMLLLVPFTALIRDFAWAAMQRTLFKNLREEIQELEKADLDPATAVQQASRKKLSETARLLVNALTPARVRQTHSRGFAFSQEENGAVNQAELIRVYDTTQNKPEGL